MAPMSLLDFVQRRAQLAGAILLDVGDPWFLQIDKFRADTEASGQRYLSFAHFDYLDLSQHPEIREAACNALEDHGTSVSASRLVGGERVMQRELELELADFVGHQDSMILSSGYVTNVTLIGHLLSKHDLIVYDELSHNSIQIGLSASRAAAKSFRHNDLEDLVTILARDRTSYRQCLIIVESLYSMDGDIVDLPRLIEIKKSHNCWLLVDEAHSIGVLGDHGRGISEHFGEDPNRIDLIVGTLSKTFVSCGGFLCARQEIIDWLRYTLSGFVYSVGLSPVITAAAHAALKLIIAQPQRTARLRLISELFLQKANAAGLNVGNALGRGIVSVIFEDLHSTLRASQALLDANIFAPPIVHVGVPKDMPRIRFFLSARHEAHHLDEAINVLRAEMRKPRMQLGVAL